MKNNKILKETLAGVIGPSFATQLRPATSLWPPPKLAEKMTDISPKGINCSKLNDVKYFRPTNLPRMNSIQNPGQISALCLAKGEIYM